MTGLMRRESLGEAADVFGRFDRLFDEWMRMLPFRPMLFPQWRDAGNLIRVEEFQEDGTLVMRADLPGIDPDKRCRGDRLGRDAAHRRPSATRKRRERGRTMCGRNCATG